MTALARTQQPDLEKVSAQQLRALHSLFPRFALSLLGSRPDATHCPPERDHLLSPDGRGDDLTLLRQLSSPTFESARGQRLAWASGVLGHELASFSALSTSEAATLIDTMKKALGQKVRPPRRRPDRDQARAYGTAGRRGNFSNEIRLVDEATLGLIDDLLSPLGWTQQRLQIFLRSRMSPIRSGAIRTLGEANRVIWALRNMIRRAKRAAHTQGGSAADVGR